MKAFLIGASGIVITVAIVAMVLFQQKVPGTRELLYPAPTTVRNCHELGRFIAAAEARNENIDDLARNNWLYTMYNDATEYINTTFDSLRSDIKHTRATLDEERTAYRSLCHSSADNQNFVPPLNNPHFRVIAKH
jgi:hypothetical protein